MLRMVCFGDSLTARKEGFDKPMLTSKLSAILKSFEVINAGVSGDNTCDALLRIESDVVKHNPDVVTVLFGANDAAFHKQIDLKTFKENLYKIVHILKPERTVLISPAPVDERVQFARTNKVLFAYAAAVKEVSVETNSHFIDFFSELISVENYPQKLKGLENDGLHFGEEGYDFLVQLIKKKIEATR